VKETGLQSEDDNFVIMNVKLSKSLAVELEKFLSEDQCPDESRLLGARSNAPRSGQTISPPEKDW
jgi:hypothetical protein